MNRQMTTTVIAVVLLATAGWLAFGRDRVPADIRLDYFYDLDTGELFTAPRDQLAPFPAPGGGTAVKATVFSCESCDNRDTHFIGWLERYSDEAKTLMRTERQSETDDVDPKFNEAMAEGHQIAFIDDAGGELTWQSSSDPQVVAQMRHVLTRCEGVRRTEACNPHPDDH